LLLIATQTKVSTLELHHFPINLLTWHANSSKERRFPQLKKRRTDQMKSKTLLPRARRDGLVIQKLDDETLVYDLERDEAHCLNQTAALVWQRCDGNTTDEGMATLLQTQFQLQVDADLVWLAVKQLQRFHLIEDDEGSTTKARAVTRRELLLKYAPAALALPVIMSISAPTPAQACSQPAGRANGCACTSNGQCASNFCSGGTCQPNLA